MPSRFVGLKGATYFEMAAAHKVADMHRKAASNRMAVLTPFTASHIRSSRTPLSQWFAKCGAIHRFGTGCELVIPIGVRK